MMKRLLLTLMLLLLAGLSFAQNSVFDFYTDSLKLKSDNDALIADFERKVKHINPEFSFQGMKTVIINDAPSGYYLPKTNNIYLPRWETMPQMFKDFGKELTGSKEKGEELSKLFFYGFFLPHEIGHGLQYNAKKLHDNEYDNEYEANVIAILYWKQLGKNKELNRCYEIAKSVLKNIKNPIPNGKDYKAYFTKHYEEFSQDPNKYGYIMFHQIVTAFENQAAPNFDVYIKKILSRE